MSDFRMKTLVLGSIRTNCYIVSNGSTKEALVFDPADNPEKIEQYLKENDLVCKGILLTHGHFDHILAVSELASKTGAPIYANENEEELLKSPDLNASAGVGKEIRLSADYWLKDQEELTLAGFTIKVIHTPGHTIGGTCYYFSEDAVLISGDTLFYENVGRCDLPTGNGQSLYESIKSKLMILEDKVKVFPGHGTSTTIGHEREHNYYLSHDPRYWD